MHQWECLPAWACVLLNRVYRDWCCTDTLHPPLCNSPPSETERQSGWATEALSSSASSSPTTVERIHLSQKKKMFHFMHRCSRLGDYHLTFHTYSQLEVLKVEDWGLSPRWPTNPRDSLKRLRHHQSNVYVHPGQPYRKLKRARRLSRARRKTSPHSHCRTSPQRKRGRANLTPSAAWPLTWLTYSHRPEKHRFIRTVKKKSPCSLCVYHSR